MKKSVIILFATIFANIATAQKSLTAEQLCQEGHDCYNNKEYAEAFRLYKEAAEQGLAKAQFFLGHCYENGQGVGQNNAEAVQWYRKAAEQGNVYAQCALGICYARGRGIEKNYTEAEKWYRMAAEQGYDDAQCALGSFYWDNVLNREEAAIWFRKAAEQGHGIAQLRLGDCYRYGTGVEQNYDMAIQWYKKAAEQGNDYAQWTLGFIYENGEGVKQDYEKAKYWYQKANEQKKINAQVRQEQSNDDDEIQEESNLAMSSQEKQTLLEHKYKEYICNLDQDFKGGPDENYIPKYIPTDTKRIYGCINNDNGSHKEKIIVYCDSPKKKLKFLSPPNLHGDNSENNRFYDDYKDYKIYNNHLYLIHYMGRHSWHNMLSLYYVDLSDNSWHEIVSPGSCDDKTEFVGNQIKAQIYDESSEDYCIKWINME